MTNDDEILIDICKLFDKNKIKYWVCHGSLLGIIRENRLLPWDDDIDIAVLDNDTDKKEVIRLLESFNYKHAPLFGENDCLHFEGYKKTIDISFYKTDRKFMSVKWVVPSSNLIKRFIILVGAIFSEGNSRKRINFSSFRKISISILASIIMLFNYILPNTLRNELINLAKKFVEYRGYKYPISFNKLESIIYKNYLIKVPDKPERTLEYTYGVNWRSPNKEYVWHEEATNLIDFR
jgi:phosphorylcholine metabolism protein LicD